MTADLELDCRGMLCPRPVIELGKRYAEVPVGGAVLGPGSGDNAVQIVSSITHRYAPGDKHPDLAVDIRNQC